ncbi:MAG TPA: hypothetical protein VFA50_17095 [Stellaceae bacterium]|nr:hypothetical protein [Stellaceae bacterium]
MPIAPGPVTQPPLPAAPQIVPQGQRVVPVEPARRVTANKRAEKAGIDEDRKKRRQDGDRGGVLDLEV